MDSLRGKKALLTGAGGGLGSEMARALGREGVQLALSGRGEAALRRLAAELAESGVRCVTLPADLSDREQVGGLVARTEEALGPIDIVVNNAGITRDSTMRKLTRDMWDQVIDTNLGSCFNMSKAVWEGMNARGFGRIVNIGSINGQGGQYGQVNYAAAKSGIHGFTKALAQEGASKGITVNAIAPGYTETDMVAAVPPNVLEKIVAKIPVGRLGKADEIARGVMFLVADDAGFITGSTLSINGGQHMY
jgi:acetoacetyl-CoA reductase